MKRYLRGLLLAGLLVAPLAAQMPAGYLDITVAKVKMGKRPEFDAVNKRIVELMRKAKADNWLAYELIYGESNTVYFVAQRASYNAVGEAMTSWMSTMTKSLGVAGMQKLFNSWDATVESERTEFRRRRWDLSANAPTDQAAYVKLVGQARFLRTAVVRVRPGHMTQFEEQLKNGKEAQERANPGTPFFVSQDVAGGPTGLYRITSLHQSLADLDEVKPLREVMGAAYADTERATAEAVLGTEVMVGRFLPELSNPPDDVAAVDPKFWRPAPPPPPPPAKPAPEAKK